MMIHFNMSNVRRATAMNRESPDWIGKAHGLSGFCGLKALDLVVKSRFANINNNKICCNLIALNLSPI